MQLLQGQWKWAEKMDLTDTIEYYVEECRSSDLDGASSLGDAAVD